MRCAAVFIVDSFRPDVASQLDFLKVSKVPGLLCKALQ